RAPAPQAADDRRVDAQGLRPRAAAVQLERPALRFPKRGQDLEPVVRAVLRFHQDQCRRRARGLLHQRRLAGRRAAAALLLGQLVSRCESDHRAPLEERDERPALAARRPRPHAAAVGAMSRDYIPALGYRWLTPAYDAAVALTTRERTFKRALIEQAKLQAQERVLDLACGTATLTIMAKRDEPTAELTGIDGDPQMLKRACRKA